MTLCTLRLEKAAGVPASRVPYSVRLRPTTALTLDAPAAVQGLVADGKLGADGTAVVTLTPTQTLIPAGMVYEATFRPAGTPVVTLVFGGWPVGASAVEASAWVTDLPGSVAPTALSGAVATLRAVIDGLVVHGSMGATETFDAATVWHTGTLDANCTFSLTGAVAGKASTLKLLVSQDATGGRAVTWPASVKWPGDVAPTFPTTASTSVTVVLTSVDGGVKWLGALVAASAYVYVPPVAPTAPGAPTIGVATAASTTATVNWTLGSTGGSALSGHTVTLYNAATNAVLATQAVGAAVTTYQFTGLTNGTGVYGKVAATNAIGTSAQSAASNTVTPAPGATVPGAPTIGTATAGDASASVAFTAPASNGGSAITGYTATSTPGGLTGSGASSPVTVSGLTNGTAYTFTVHATNAIGNSPESAASNSVTPVAAFSLANYSNLVHWIEADQIGGAPADGAAIATATDLSVSALNLTQATAGKRPIYKASVAAFNNKPVLRFASASAQVLDAASCPSTLGDNYTHIVICSTADVLNEDAVFAFGDAAGTGGRVLFPDSGSSAGGTGKVGLLMPGAAWQDTTFTPPSTPAIYMFRRSGGTMHLWVDGVEKTITSPTMSSGVVPTKTSLGGSGSYYHDGDLALEASYDAARTVAELNTIGTAFAAKYGTTWTTIPEFHPSQIAGMKWFEADTGVYTDLAATVPATAGGDLIRTWKDPASTLLLTVSQSVDARRPTLQLAQVNGKPVLRADGVDDVLAVALTLAQPYVIFMVAKVTNAAANAYMHDGLGPNDGLVAAFDATTARMYAGAVLDRTGVTMGGFNIVVAKFNGASSLLAVGSSSVTGAAGAAGKSGVSVFGPANVAAQCMAGDMAAFGVMASPTTQNINDVANYLATKFALPWTNV